VPKVIDKKFLQGEKFNESKEANFEWYASDGTVTSG
jgi:hypothetical protein